MNVSIVVPTFNRGPQLALTLDSLLANNTRALDSIEVIVADDGSTSPAAPIVESLRVAPPFTLSTIRQANQGPAAARNAGFRASHGEIILFIDDDIITPPDMIWKHVEAHRARPKSIICGRCFLVEPKARSPLYHYLNSIGNDPGKEKEEEFIEISIVASGQVSVERELFDGMKGVYSDNLITPAAEEFEFSHRMRRRGIRILLATRVVASHDSSVDIEAVCRQQRKYGIGCAEVASKCPPTKDLTELARMLDFSRKVRPGDSPLVMLAQTAKSILATRPSRSGLLFLTRLAERFAPSPVILPLLYRATIGLHFFSGARDGMRRFAFQSAEKSS